MKVSIMVLFTNLSNHRGVFSIAPFGQTTKHFYIDAATDLPYEEMMDKVALDLKHKIKEYCRSLEYRVIAQSITYINQPPSTKTTE